MMRSRDTVGISTIGAARARDVAGLAVLSNIRVRDAVGLSLVWTATTAMTVSVPPTASGFGTSTGLVAITSEEVTAAVTGGLAPYTYTWTKVGAVDANWLILSPTVATTQFRHAAVPANDGRFASFICTVKDAKGQVIASGECQVTVENLGGFS